MTLVVLVLLVLVSAVGLRNLAANQGQAVASTSMPVPVFPDEGKGKLFASTSMPVPVFPDEGKGKLSTGR